MRSRCILQKGLLTLSVILAVNFFSLSQNPETNLKKEVKLNFSKSSLKVDGFGVNITPAQWNNGKLKPAIDMLVDDLGATLFRFDCTGLANWLDPEKRQSNGTWTESYLDSVYKSKVFSDAWSTFRYLNQKGIEPFFNVSGRIRPGLGKSGEPNTLADFDGYAEMVVSMAKWAREKERLKFSLLAPFNETDHGYPEGPKIYGSDMVKASKAIIKKLDDNGLSDIGIIALDDTYPHIDRLNAVLSDSSYINRIYAFGTHTYGNGDIGENEGWLPATSDYFKFSNAIESSPFKNASIWITEYGDLDQTNEIEYEFAWRSTRRLMKSFRDGFNAALAWDAFDNFHEHDTAWCNYGLLKTDTVSWKYTPKKRYFAAKQVYKFVRPNWKMIEVATPQPKKFDIYKTWHDSFRHIRIQAFVSPDGNDFTVVIMNGIESKIDMTINLDDINNGALSKKIKHFVTDKTVNCNLEESTNIKDRTVRITLSANSISTITTLK